MKEKYCFEQNQKKKDVLVSVIAPCYNVEKYLQSCIESIINQTYTNLEIIFVNDCSTDNTSNILSEYAKKDNRIRIVNNAVNSGASPSRENGYNQSSGEWICFIDSDDALDPRAIEMWMDEVDEETDIIAGKFINIKDKDFEKYVCGDVNNSEVLTLQHENIMKHLGRFSQIEVSDSTWGKVFRRSLFEKSNAVQYKEKYPLAYFEDTVLAVSLLIAARKMKIINQYLYLYRVVANSMSHANGINKIEITRQRLIVFDTVLQWYENDDALLHGVECQLLQAIKLWYLVRKHYGKKSTDLQLAERMFDKWYKKYRTIKGKKSVTSSIVTLLFSMNKQLCCILVCELWLNYLGFVMHDIKKY